MRSKIYLDTSVFSAYYDSRVTDRQAETEEFWKRLSQFEASTSALTKEELSQTRDAELRQKFNDLLKQVTIFPLTKEMESLAQSYVDRGVFTPLAFNDSLHVAPPEL